MMYNMRTLSLSLLLGLAQAPFFFVFFWKCMKDNTQKIIDRLGPIVAETGCELVDAEIVFESGRKTLRIYIDRDAGVTIADCSQVTHLIGDIIEVEDLVAGAYHLEVSSPGLCRPLRTVSHFEKVKGSIVDISTKEKINNRGRYKGQLLEVSHETVVILIDGQNFEVPLAMIRKANLVA